MVTREDFENIILEYMRRNDIDENTTISIDFWNTKKFVKLPEVADILGAIPDVFIKVDIARELTNALYGSQEHFIKMLHNYAQKAIRGKL
jgi:hypothetical protein